MQDAAIEGRSRASPDKADKSSKKAQHYLPYGHMKQEAAGGGDGGAIVTAAYNPRLELAVRIDKKVLHCPVCTLPFKPPVFQCKVGHPACGGCVAQLPFGLCMACMDDGGFFNPCPALDAVVSSTRTGCPNAGCQWYMTYHEVAEHQKVCPHAPCHCTEPSCGYVGTPQALVCHLNSVHSVPLRAMQYGKVSQLQLPVSTPRVVLLGDDNHVFLLTVGVLGAAAAAVSVVCARARAATRPRFTCKMWVNCGMVLVVAADEPTFLPVPRMYLVPATAGDGASMEVPLHICIDKLSPWSDALV